MKRIIATLILIVASASHAWAWGSEGHRIVAEIAEQFLEPVIQADRTFKSVINLKEVGALTALLPGEGAN